MRMEDFQLALKNVTWSSLIANIGEVKQVFKMDGLLHNVHKWDNNQIFQESILKFL